MFVFFVITCSKLYIKNTRHTLHTLHNRRRVRPDDSLYFRVCDTHPVIKRAKLDENLRPKASDQEVSNYEEQLVSGTIMSPAEISDRNRFFEMSCMDGDCDNITKLIDDCTAFPIPDHIIRRGFLAACVYGQHDIVALLDCSYITFMIDEDTFNAVCDSKNVKMIKFLITYGYDITGNANPALIRAIQQHDLKLVKLLCANEEVAEGVQSIIAKIFHHAVKSTLPIYKFFFEYENVFNCLGEYSVLQRQAIDGGNKDIVRYLEAQEHRFV